MLPLPVLVDVDIFFVSPIGLGTMCTETSLCVLFEYSNKFNSNIDSDYFRTRAVRDPQSPFRQVKTALKRFRYHLVNQVDYLILDSANLYDGIFLQMHYRLQILIIEI